MTEATTPTPNPTPLWLIVRLAYKNKSQKNTYDFTIRSATAMNSGVSVVLPLAKMFVTYSNDHTKAMSENEMYI